MNDVPTITLLGVDLFERPVTFRLPFKFGAVTLRAAPQLFVRATVSVDGQETQGIAAELCAPKWFDKNPDLTNEQNFDQLRASLRTACRTYLAFGPAPSAFALHACTQAAHYDACAAHNLNGLIASYGTALLDRAILDALGKAEGTSIFETIRTNRTGIDASTTPDLYGHDIAAALATLPAPNTIAVRHTVGMVDAIRETGLTERLDDGLPESLEAVVATYGHRHFKLKVGGDVDADIARLTAIADVLDGIDGESMVSIDGNEQYADAGGVLELLDAIEAAPALARLWANTAYLEQPIARARALSEPVHAIAARKPVAVDESDAHIGIFPVARALGYRGISSKSCKGFYRAVLNAVRVAKWNGEAGNTSHFIIAEDLTTQAGVAVQQDFALAALVGATHVERNGHHFVDGFGTSTQAEQDAFLAAHGDLYEKAPNDRVRLAIRDGAVSLASLHVPGLAAPVEPVWADLTPLPMD